MTSGVAPIVSLFNHKGGVSKTTTTFNLGYALADAGKRVLIVDADPQCNLTGTVLGLIDSVDFEDFYTDNGHANISGALESIFSGKPGQLNPALITDTTKDGLYLLPGNLKLAEYETQLSVALSTRWTIPALQNLPGSICSMLRVTALEEKVDIVLVDMSPSVGALNQCLLMGSDFFIIPTSPDYYCCQAISSLSRVLPRWNQEAESFRDTSLAYPFPPSPPKFCGIISQRFRPRNGAPARSYQNWIDTIKERVNTELVPILNQIDMCVSVREFNSARPGDAAYNLINIADFNTLISLSQDHSVPIFALSDDQIPYTGAPFENMKKSRHNFSKCFSDLAKSVSSLTMKCGA